MASSALACSGKVNIVIACAGPYYYLKFGGCCDDLCGNLVGADNHGFGIRHRGHQVFLGGILFEQDNIVPRSTENIFDAVYGSCRKGLLGCYKYFHIS